MVFRLPGVGGCWDVGGGGDSWDRNEGDGDWQKASEEQLDRAKRLVANTRRNEIRDSELSDVEEDLELLDKKTGKKLTFVFPDAPPRRKGSGKRSGNGNKFDEPNGEKEKKSPQKDIQDDEAKGKGEKNPIQEKGEPKGVKTNVEPKEDEEDLYDVNYEDLEVVHEYPVKKGSSPRVFRQKGGPPPQQKCQYELIRERIIADREKLMSMVLADIQKTSREIVEENKKCKKRKATDQGKARQEKKRKVERVVDIEGGRRSARERKPVNYCAVEDDDDQEWQPKGKRKKVERKLNRTNDHIHDRKPLPPGWKPRYNHIRNSFEKNNSKNEGESLSEDKNEVKDANSEETGRISLRKRKYVNYNFDGPRADEFVFCDRCGEDKYHGCELHPLIFDYVANFEVAPSKVAKNAGRGVFNIDIRGDIPEGVMFGPYDGIFYTPKEYNRLKKNRGESGYAWELRDHDKVKVIGYVDPGPNPDPIKQWMSIVNCASKTRNQNLMPGQFMGGIYYRSIQIIPYGTELQVDYGNDYAREIKIKVEEKDLYELDEDWRVKGVNCPHCNGGFVKEEYLQKHIQKAGNTAGGCKVLKQIKNREDVMSGAKPVVCDECDKGFRFHWELKAHKVSHSNARPFECDECDKTYKVKSQLKKHKNAEHLGIRFTCEDCKMLFKCIRDLNVHRKRVCDRQEKELKCNRCGKEFNCTSNLKRHIKTVHEKQLPFKCELCEKRFGEKGKLKIHISTVHEKIRSHECEYCGQKFTQAASLDKHTIRKHTFQWYYNCDVCDEKLGIEDETRGWISPSELKKHMMAKHPEEYKEQVEREKPAVCPKCQKRFPSEEQVEIHLEKMHNFFTEKIVKKEEAEKERLEAASKKKERRDMEKDDEEGEEKITQMIFSQSSGPISKLQKRNPKKVIREDDDVKSEGAARGKSAEVETHLTKSLEEKVKRLQADGDEARTSVETISVLSIKDSPAVPSAEGRERRHEPVPAEADADEGEGEALQQSSQR